jgi:hypothetical protein
VSPENLGIETRFKAIFRKKPQIFEIKTQKQDRPSKYVHSSKECPKAFL